MKNTGSLEEFINDMGKKYDDDSKSETQHDGIAERPKQEDAYASSVDMSARKLSGWGAVAVLWGFVLLLFACVVLLDVSGIVPEIEEPTEASQISLDEPSAEGELILGDDGYYVQRADDDMISFRLANSDGDIITGTSCVCAYGEHPGQKLAEWDRLSHQILQTGLLVRAIEDQEVPYAKIWHDVRYCKGSVYEEKNLVELSVDDRTADMIANLTPTGKEHKVGEYVITGQVKEEGNVGSSSVD